MTRATPGIRAADGAMVLDDGRTLLPFQARAWFLDDFRPSSEEVLIENPPRITYRLRGVAIDGRLFVLDVAFHSDALASLSLAIDRGQRDWSDWSKEVELAVKDEHDRWLVSQLGTTSFDRPWGTVESVYDPRSGGSDITIRYKPR
jgi:hypothetical protein